MDIVMEKNVLEPVSGEVDASVPATPDKVQTSLDYLESVYETYRAPGGPDWDGMG